MEITLEKIELVKDRTGVGYKEAKDALEKTDGSVVDAIILIEETIDDSTKETEKISRRSGISDGCQHRIMTSLKQVGSFCFYSLYSFSLKMQNIRYAEASSYRFMIDGHRVCLI